MATGFNVRSDSGRSDPKDAKARSLLQKVKRIVLKYGIDDEEWIKAISGQFFLLCICSILGWHNKKDYEHLMDSCLASFRMTYRGELILDESTLRITPEETVHIMDLMKKEDDDGGYFARFSKTAARNINGQRMYLNYHYALLLRIASEENINMLATIKKQCLKYLFSENALDDSDGWYPYRVPWITGRILTNLKSVDFSDYEHLESADSIIKRAIESLYERIDDTHPAWRSGFGSWVTLWESTGLCLEALYKWGTIEEHRADIKRVLDYVLSDDIKRKWINVNKRFNSEESSGEVLGGIVLSSTILRITRKYFEDLYDQNKNEIYNYFEYVIGLINNGDVEKVGQFTTVPQILYYILLSIRDN